MPTARLYKSVRKPTPHQKVNHILLGDSQTISRTSTNRMTHAMPEQYESDQFPRTSSANGSQSDHDTNRCALIDVASGLPNIGSTEETSHNVSDSHEIFDLEMLDTEPPVVSVQDIQSDVKLDKRFVLEPPRRIGSRWDSQRAGFGTTSDSRIKSEDQDRPPPNYQPSRYADSTGLPLVRVENLADTPSYTPLSCIPRLKWPTSSEQELCNYHAESPLLKLPPKLRMNIFQYCVPSKPLSLACTRKHYIRDTKHNLLPKPQDDATKTIAWTSLFTVSRTIHLEYTEVFYENAQLSLVFPEDYHLIEAVEDWCHDFGLFRPCWAPALKVPDFRNLGMKMRMDAKTRNGAELAFVLLKEVVNIRDDLSSRCITVDLTDYDTKKVVSWEGNWPWTGSGRKDEYHEVWDNIASEVSEMISSYDLEVWVQYWKSDGEVGMDQAVKPSREEFIAKCKTGNIDARPSWI